jgi:hypothetical protein
MSTAAHGASITPWAERKSKISSMNGAERLLAAITAITLRTGLKKICREVDVVAELKPV